MINQFIMELFNYAYFGIFIVALVYLLTKNRESFLIKILVSIPVMAGMVYFSGSFYILPISFPFFSLFIKSYFFIFLSRNMDSKIDMEMAAKTYLTGIKFPNIAINMRIKSTVKGK